MKEKIVAKLLSAKFLIAMMVMATVCYLAIAGRIDANEFLKLGEMVAGAYFIISIATKKGANNE